MMKTVVVGAVLSAIIWATWTATEAGIVPDVVAPVCTAVIVTYLYGRSRS